MEEDLIKASLSRDDSWADVPADAAAPSWITDAVSPDGVSADINPPEGKLGTMPPLSDGNGATITGKEGTTVECVEGERGSSSADSWHSKLGKMIQDCDTGGRYGKVLKMT